MTPERASLQAILDSMAEGVVAVDLDRKLIHINQAAAELLEVEIADSLGREVDEVVPSIELCTALDDILQNISQGTSERRLMFTEGDHVLQVRTSPVQSADELTGAVALFHDIGDLHRLETVRRDFVANVSHELKTPITAIRGLVETLIDDDDMPEETHARFLIKIREQSHRLSAIVVDLLTISRLEAGGTIEKRRLDLREVAQASVRAVLPAAERRGVELLVDVPTTPVTIVGDDEALRQGIGNLIDNAIKYTPPSGQVRLLLRSEESVAVLQVTDTGVGIEPQHQSRIFERFYRIDKARSRELGGTGLGLSIVKHVCIAHGGDVSVSSEPGRGSTFRIRLPLATAPTDAGYGC